MKIMQVQNKRITMQMDLQFFLKIESENRKRNFVEGKT